MLTYVPKLDQDIINSYNLDIMKILKQYKDKEIQEISNSSIGISVAVTAYSRIHMNKLKLYI